MNTFKQLSNNCARPENNCFGKIILAGVNIAHTKVSKWGFSQFNLTNEQKILDIGCGGGKNISRFLHALPEAKVYGIDYSSESVRKSTKLNARAIKEGRSEIIEGNVTAMPYADETFDVISAFETIYFWQPIETSFKEVRRVLKTGGRFFIICEMDNSKIGQQWASRVNGMKTYSLEQLKTLLEESGFKVSGTNTKKSSLFIEATK